MIHSRAPWKHVDDVEYATADWVDRFNHRSLDQHYGDVPPTGREGVYHPQPPAEDSHQAVCRRAGAVDASPPTSVT